MMATPSTTVHISVDLLYKARPYLEFLESYLRHASVWTNTNALRRAIYRYEHLWLPLANDTRGRADLEAPADVRWVWYLHMLLVGHYTAYCRERFGRLIPHVLHVSTTEAKAARDHTADIWHMKYRTEPFELDVTSLIEQSKLPPSRLGEVMGLALQQQAFFFYQVSLPHYRDKKFLQSAVDRYKMFLFAEKFIVGSCTDTPCDIELVWRIHALHPQDYVRDTAFLNQLYDPYQPYTDGVDVCNNSLKQKWKQLYSEPYFIEGTVGRGPPVTADVVTMPKDKQVREMVHTCSITVDDLEVADPDNKTGIKKDTTLFVDIRRLNDSSFSYSVIATVRGVLDKRMHLKGPPAEIEFDSRTHRGLEFHIYSKVGSLCFARQQSHATLFYSPRKHFDGGSFYNRRLPVEIQKVVSTDPVVKFTCEVKAEKRKPHVLLFERQPFTQQACPNRVQRCVQDEPTWRSALQNVDFLAARHR